MNYGILILGIILVGILSVGTSYAISVLANEKVSIVNPSSAAGQFTEFAFDSDITANRAHIYHFNPNFGASGKYTSGAYVIENDIGKLVLSSKTDGLDIYTNNALTLSISQFGDVTMDPDGVLNAGKFLKVNNPSSGTGAFTEYGFNSDNAPNRAHIYHFNTNYATSGKYASTAFVIENDLGKVILSSKNTGIDFYTTNTLAVSITGGNMGIGTASPAEKLDVAGNIRLTGNIVSPSDICIGTC